MNLLLSVMMSHNLDHRFGRDFRFLFSFIEARTYTTGAQAVCGLDAVELLVTTDKLGTSYVN